PPDSYPLSLHDALPIYRANGAAFELPSIERRVARERLRVLRLERPFQLGIDHGYISGAAGGKRSGFNLQKPRGTRGKHFDQPRQDRKSTRLNSSHLGIS